MINYKTLTLHILWIYECEHFALVKGTETHMKSFEWDKHFETGLSEVDEQHLYLVGFVNQYGGLLSENNVSTDDVRKALFELARYAEFHFKEEEQLMRNAGIAEEHLSEHIQVHRSFMLEINSMQAFIADDDHRPAVLLLEFLIHWLAYHILGIDQSMARQVKAIEEGEDPFEAYKREQRERDAAIEPLLNALNGLFQQVSARNKELVRLNQSLEDKVEERTRQLHRANKQLEKLSLTDSLTSLPNRRQAMQQLQEFWLRSVEEGNNLTCMMIDADHFKHVNDTWGHDAGDSVLIAVSRSLKQRFRNDDIVCRLGGDEFFVICPNTDLEGGLYIAQQVLAEINQLKVSVGEDSWQGSISVGVAQCDSEMKEYTALMSLADKALYKAKQHGRNQVCFAKFESI